jgi:hypothetical protein
MDTFAWLMKAVRTMGIRLTAFFASKCPDPWSEPSLERLPEVLLA